MRRRQFIAGLGSAAAWPVVTRAQQAAMPVVGYLSPQTAGDDYKNFAVPFLQGLKETGFVEGQNVAIEYRYAENQVDRLPQLAIDLVRRRVAVIVANGTAPALAAKAATTIIPIVFSTGGDPVALGLVASFNRPGGNLTGVAFLSTELGPKRVEFLKMLVPAATRYALLVHPEAGDTEADIEGLTAAAASVGRHLEVFYASNIGEIDAAYAELVRKGADAVVVGSSSFLSTRGVQLATLATYHRLPAIYYNRRIVEAGGLMSYGADIQDAVRQCGIYIGRILKGEKAADLPVTQAVKFELVLNIGTARTMGIIVPPTLLAIADEVIE
jgi:putative tryptophan/tyrosine transport system substrate-binding protein